MIDEKNYCGYMQSEPSQFHEMSSQWSGDLAMQRSAAEGFSDGDFESVDNGLVVLLP